MEKLPINPSEPVKGVHLYQALPALITHVLCADTVELQDGKIFYNIVNIMRLILDAVFPRRSQRFIDTLFSSFLRF